jgi:hypothetical protein
VVPLTDIGRARKRGRPQRRATYAAESRDRRRADAPDGQLTKQAVIRTGRKEGLRAAKDRAAELGLFRMFPPRLGSLCSAH